MKTRHTLLSIAVAAVMAMALSAHGASKSPPQEGDLFPDVKLAMPDAAEQRNYLGLSQGKSFAVTDIKATIVIIEILSMYCPHCQREAPLVNELYRVIEGNPAYRGTVKLIGIGAGNSAFETKVFREKYDVPFPVIPDGDFYLHRELGEARTPFFIGVRIEEGTARVFYAKLGGFEKPDEFLKLLLDRAGLPKGGAS